MATRIDAATDAVEEQGEDRTSSSPIPNEFSLPIPAVPWRTSTDTQDADPTPPDFDPQNTNDFVRKKRPEATQDENPRTESRTPSSHLVDEQSIRRTSLLDHHGGSAPEPNDFADGEGQTELTKKECNTTDNLTAKKSIVAKTGSSHSGRLTLRENINKRFSSNVSDTDHSTRSSAGETAVYASSMATNDSPRSTPLTLRETMDRKFSSNVSAKSQSARSSGGETGVSARSISGNESPRSNRLTLRETMNRKFSSNVSAMEDITRQAAGETAISASPSAADDSTWENAVATSFTSTNGTRHSSGRLTLRETMDRQFASNRRSGAAHHSTPPLSGETNRGQSTSLAADKGVKRKLSGESTLDGSSSFDAAPMSEKQWERKRAALDAAARTPSRQAAPLGAQFVPGEPPDEPSVPTPDAVDRPVSNPSTPGAVSVPGRAPGNVPAWGRRVRAMGSLVSNRHDSRLSHRGSRNGSSVAVTVEATLVNEHNNGDEAEEEGVVPSAAVARPLKFGLNFGDKRVRLVLVLIALAFIGLVVALGVSLSSKANDESTTATTDNELNAVESTLRPTTTPSKDPREPTLSPTALAGSSSSPTTAPTSLPSSTPTMAPTHWAWKEIARLQGAPAKGMFGSKVMMSAKGNRLAVSYKKQQELCVRGRNRALGNAATKRDLACQTSYSFVEVFGQNSSDSVEWTFMGRFSIGGFELEKNVAVALSGNGERVAIVSRSGSGVYVVRDADPSNAFTSTHFGFSVDDTLGADVALSHDGNIVAVAQPGSDSGNGKVEVTKHEEECFFGPPNFTPCITSEAIRGGPGLSSFGQTLSLSSSGSVMACGGSNGNTSVVQVYENLDETWSAMGTEIEAKAIPSSTSLSADGRRIALGGSDLPQTNASVPVQWHGEGGEARVLDYNATTKQWTQVGDSIETGTMGQNYVAVSLSGDGTTLAVGARSSDAGGIGSGVARVYRFDGVSWVQIGMDIYDGGGDNLGASVSLGLDGRRVAVGAPNNRDTGVDIGAAMVYEMTSLH